ncbi:MAG: hypothetical protein IJI98_06325 [Methanosphaera sp.]|nr:hypothetical protein [Methanosphaera sp.]
MNEKNMIILCVTVIVCVGLVCGTILLTHNSNKVNDTNNSIINNTTVNSTLNDSNNTTNTSTEKTSSSKTSQSTSKKSSSSSYSSKATGDNVPTRDSNGNRVFRDGEWVGTSEGGAHVYKDPRTGQLFDSRGNLPKNYKYDSR